MSDATAQTDTATSDDAKSDEKSFADYWPLVSLILLTLAAAAALESRDGLFSASAFMHTFMGFFLVVYALLKIFDLPGFAEGFAMYDLLAKRWQGYGFVYPFLELALGLAYLAEFSLPITYGVTIALMIFSAAGVLRAMSNDLDVDCACMGSALDVPLSTVSLVENVGMALMAATMLTLMAA